MRSQPDIPRGCRCQPPRREILPILLWAAFLVLARPAEAKDQMAQDRRPAAEAPRFYVERVAVEGTRHASSEVILSESWLEEGIAYTETELIQAMDRVQRLPFVLDAGFSLGKGSERGRYSLLIMVEEVERFFFGSDLGYTTFGDSLESASAQGDELTDSLSVGMRVFAGQGVFFAAAGNGEDLQAGYERYRLFGRPLLLRLAYAREGCCTADLQELGLDPGAAVWRLADEADRFEVTIGVPIAANHSLRVNASSLEADSAARRPLGGHSDATSALGYELDVQDVGQQELELAWVFDSTDDPVFPTRGDALTAAVGLRWLEGDLSQSAAVGPGLETLASGAAAEMSSRLVGVSFFGERHWPLSARQTVSLSLKLLASRTEVDRLPVESDPDDPTPIDASAETGNGSELTLWSGDVDSFEADLGARYSLSLWGPGKIRRLGELRWETVAGLIYIETSPTLSLAAHPLWGLSVSTGIALRNTWGLFRIGFTYLDFDGAL